MLAIDTSFSLHMIRSRNLESSVTCRDLDGFFEHVWTVNPCAGSHPDEPPESSIGPLKITEITLMHTFVEGRVGRSLRLKKLPQLNFVLSQIGVFFFLNRLIRTCGIRVIRAGDPYYQGLLGLGLASINRIPLVIRVGGNFDAIYKATGKPIYPRLFRWRRVEKWIERHTLRHADLVAGANQDNLDFALESGASRERSTLFRYGNLIDSRHFSDPASRPKVHGELKLKAERFLIYVGRLEPVKHPDDVLRVLAEVRRKGMEVGAVLVGDGSMKNQLQELAQILGIESHVLFTGNRDQGWIANLLPTAAVVVSPHTGRALTEAALSGTPIVAYDIDWQSELIRSGETGELVPYKDWQQMAEAVCRLLTDTERAKRLGRQGRAAALQMMDPVKLTNHERAAYQGLLKCANS